VNARRVLAVARKALGQFRHDRRTLAFIVVMPFFMVVVFGLAFGGSVSHVRTLVVNEDGGGRAADILAGFEGDTLDLVAAEALDAAVAEVRSGRAWAVLHFPANFTANLAPAARNATIELYLDATSPVITAAILGELRAAVEEALAGAGAPLSIERTYVYGSEDTRSIDAFAPGVVGLAVMMVTTLFSVIILVRERAGGILERLFSTPLRPSEFVLGHALALGLLAVLQSLVVLSAAVLAFEVKVAGNVALAFLFLLVFAIGNQGLGIMMSAAARNELQAIQFIPVILFPSMLLTGIFFPLEALPPWLRPLSNLVPLTYASNALHGVMLRGWGLAELWPELLILLGYGAFALVGATAAVRRQA
jgi:ABC-2 type transport system permease protein